MQYILNIGLDNLPPEAGNSIGVKALFVSRAIRRAGFYAEPIRKVVESDSEFTLVVEATFSSYFGVPQAINDLAVVLAQDCIAVYCKNNGEGRLIGPRADNWGVFNPELFFKLDGTRLAPRPFATLIGGAGC